MEYLRLFAFVSVLVACISVTSGGLILKGFASPQITEQALASATQQLESFSYDHSGARVRRATGDEDGELCDDKVATCQKGVLAVGPVERTCVDIYNASKCTFESFVEEADDCGKPEGGVATGKFVVASYIRGFLSVSCKPKTDEEVDNSRYQGANKCVDKYYTKVMRTSDPTTIAYAVCCGNVEMLRCMSSHWTASLRTKFVELSYRRFVRVNPGPQFGFEGCQHYSVKKCAK